MSSESKYIEFHGHQPHFRKEVDINDIEELIILGKAVAIEYECNKYNGGGDGKSTIYRHEFETPAIVCMDQTGRRQIYILGNKLKVTEAGIEN